MEATQLNVEIRDKNSTKKILSTLRKERKVPGVVYGGSGANLAVVVSERELLGALKAGGNNAILHLKHKGGEDTVILKSLQRHVVTHQPIHADFQRISLKKKIEVKVPIHVLGEAPGVKLQGGVLEHSLRDLKIRCLPNAIPQKIDVDVSALEVGHNILVSDLSIPADVEVLEALDHIVVNIVHATEEAVVAPAEAPVAGAEPEVITKGKKEEGEAEGKAKPEAGKAAKAEPGKQAKPEAGKDAGKKEASK